VQSHCSSLQVSEKSGKSFDKFFKISCKSDRLTYLSHFWENISDNIFRIQCSDYISLIAYPFLPLVTEQMSNIILRINDSCISTQGLSPNPFIVIQNTNLNFCCLLIVGSTSTVLFSGKKQKNRAKCFTPANIFVLLRLWKKVLSSDWFNRFKKKFYSEMLVDNHFVKLGHTQKC